MDFGDDQDTNNPFVGSSYDVFNDNIDHYFSTLPTQSQSILTDPYHTTTTTISDQSNMDYSSMGIITIGSSNMGLPTVVKQDIEIISTDTINGIVYYIIKLSSNDSIIKRRYSDFQSLRINLVKFFPTKIIPLIPEKHSLKDYITNKKLRNSLIIDFRKRKFNSFLNQLNRDEDIRNSIIFQKFIDPMEEIWLEVLKYSPFTLLPSNVLLSSTRDPTKPNPYYSYLPIPPMLALKHFDTPLNDEVFKPIELKFINYKLQLNKLEQHSKQLIAILKKFTMRKVELGASFNVFSLLDNNTLVEKIGQLVDLEFINLEVFIKNFIVSFKEPLQDLKNNCSVLLQLLQFRKYKELQLHHLKQSILKKQSRAMKLISTENLHLKLDLALQKGSEESPTIAEAVKRLKLENLKKNRDTGISTTRKQRGGFYKLFGNNTKATKTHNEQQQQQQQYIETKDIQLMSSQERLNELTYLNQEIHKLESCFDLLINDEIYLNVEIERNCHLELEILKKSLFKIVKNFEKIILIYCKELNHWPTGEAPI